MKYISTRSKEKEYNFGEVFIKGLADDGGLFIPKLIPKLSNEELLKLSKLNYKDLAREIIYLFSGDTITKDELSSVIEKSYSKFNNKEVVKITNINENNLLELFHGPTLAFKDVAMQFIGNLYDHYLKDNNKKINIVVATSGDTGAAAIDAIKGKDKMNIFVLHPHNKVSLVQRKLMTTVKEKNVFNLAIKGNFDDCQNIVKSMFADFEFSNSINMSAVNSINWVRIVAQSVYYFYCYFKLNKKINFSVPTGNFGDVYAGYLSKKMGLPINKLIVATNQNDILHRAISSGNYEAQKVKETISPSMDIQVASNFERLVYDIQNQDTKKTKNIMMDIKNNNKYKIDDESLIRIRDSFLSASLNENETLEVIKKIYENQKIILDPHSAVGYGALEKLKIQKDAVVLATAHPCKFPEAILKAIDKNVNLPNNLKNILEEKENFSIIENNIDKVKAHVAASLAS
jgi:threonine synthase